MLLGFVVLLVPDPQEQGSKALSQSVAQWRFPEKKCGKLVLDYTTHLLNPCLHNNCSVPGSPYLHERWRTPDSYPICPQSRNHSLFRKATQSNCLKTPLHLAQVSLKEIILLSKEFSSSALQKTEDSLSLAYMIFIVRLRFPSTCSWSYFLFF